MNESNKTEQSDKSEFNVVEPRKIWKLATIGLPDSGKSTFLARLYAAHIEGDKDRGGDRFMLSFPPAISESDEEREVLRKIEDLWNWIRNNYDAKLKTFDKADIVFNISGRSLPKGISVHTSDAPGETFKSYPDVGTDIIDPEVLKKLKKDFRQICRSAQSVMVLISADEVDDVKNGALVKTMLEYMPKRTWYGMPIFKLVVITKAANQIHNNDFQRRIRELETIWHKQGFKWLKVIACESLADLKKTEVVGKPHWELPPAGSKPPYPKWVHTPYSAILELPRMHVSWRRWFKFKLSLSIAVIMAALCGTWVYQGQVQDNRVFRIAESRPLDERREALETYLTASRASDSNWYYPFRHNKEDAIRLWNNHYYDELEKLNIEERTNELERVKTPRLWRFVDKERHTEVNRHTQGKIRDISIQHEKNLEEWLTESQSSDNPLQIINEKRIQASQLPSLDQETERHRSLLRRRYEEEQQVVNSFSELANDWRARIQELTRGLESLTTASPLTYRVLQDRRNERLLQLGLDVCNIGGEHIPFKSLNLLRTIQGAIRKQVGHDSDMLTRLKDAENDVEEQIRRLEKTSAEKHVVFNKEPDWGKKVEICRTTVDLLKDHPLADEWKQREHEWRDKVKASEDSIQELRNNISKAPTTPQQQIDLLQSYLSEGALVVSQQHRDWARNEMDRLKSEKKEIDDRWAALADAASRFENNRQSMNELSEAIAAYESMLRRQSRPSIADHEKRYTEIKSKLKNEVEEVRELISKADELWASMLQARPPQSTAILEKIAAILPRLFESYDQSYSQRRIDEFYTRIDRLADTNLVMRFGMDDVHFREAIDALGLGLEYATALGKSEEDRQQLIEKQRKVISEWSRQRWDTEKDEADKSAGRGAYAAAITQLQGYRDRKATAYEIFRGDADQEIKRHADAWRKSLLRQMDDVAGSRIRQRSDYDERREQIDRQFSEYEQVMGKDRVDASIRAGNKSAIDGLDKELRYWYVQRVNILLSGLPTVEDKRILDTWVRITELGNLLREIENDKTFTQSFRGDAARIRRMGERINSLHSDVNFRLRISSMNIRMPDDGDYWGNNFPQPRLKLLCNTNSIWQLHITDKDDTSEKDSAGVVRRYQVTHESDRFVVKSDQWDNPIAEVLYSPHDELALIINIARQDSAPPQLLLIAKEQTPGRLLQTGERILREEVECSTPFLGSKFNMLIELSLQVGVEESKSVERFAIPHDYDKW